MGGFLKMKGIVVYDSSYGNTKKIAEAISETLKDSGIEVDAFYVKKEVKSSTLAGRRDCNSTVRRQGLRP
jgi:flavodoxin